MTRDNLEIGSIGEVFLEYTFKLWGVTAFRVEQNNRYDLIILLDNNIPIRVQVKTAHHPSTRISYQFNLERGFNRQGYEVGDFDVLAFVALDIERVLFFPHIHQKTIRIKEEEFHKDPKQSWLDVLDKIGYSV